MDDLETWRARIGLYCARIHTKAVLCKSGKSNCGPDTYIHGRKSLCTGASDGALLAVGLLSIAITLFSLLTVAGDVELNPGPENDAESSQSSQFKEEISASSFHILVKQLWDVKKKWLLFGAELGVTHSTLKAIDKKCRGDPDECFPELLSTWLNGDNISTWQTILNALRSPTVDMNQLAKNIEEGRESIRKVQTMTGESSSSQSSVHYISSARELLQLPVSSWYEVGIALQVDQHYLQIIQKKNSDNVEICRAQMFQKWFESNEQVCYEDLIKGLVSTTDRDNLVIAQELCKKQGISESILKVSLHPCVEKYIKDLKSRYLRVPIMKEDPWPPPPCKDYIDTVYANFSGDNLAIGGDLSKAIDQQTSVSGQLRMLIKGMPGVGKTTLCKSMTHEWAKGIIFQNYDIVLLVQLRDPRMAMAKHWEDFFYHDESSIKEKVLKYVGQQSGSCVLFIFDGFDELSKKDRCRGSLFSDIFNQQKLKQSSVIVTTRPYATQNLEQVDIFYIELVGFDQEKVKTCIKKSIQNEAQAEQLISRIMEDNNLNKLCIIPNNLAIVIYIFKQEKGKLPNTITELYTNFINNTLDRNAQELKPKKRKKYQQRLEQLAYEGLTEDKLTFNVSDMSIEESSTLGLMTASESYNSTGHVTAYNFLHLTIQEYLAACWIASNLTNEQQIDFIRSNYQNSRFYQTLIFLAGVTKMHNQHLFQALSLLFENALTDLYIHVTSHHHLNDINGTKNSIFYPETHLKSFLMLISILHERGETSIDSKYFSPELSDHVLLLNLIHLPHSYYQGWLNTFVVKSNVCWDRLEIVFDKTKGYDQITDLIKNACCKVHQIGLHNFSLLNCSTLLECSAFDKLEYLRVDSILYFRERTIEGTDQTVWWGADYHPKKCNKIKDLLEEGTLKHLLLHHITPLEAEYIIEQSVTPYLAKCTSLQTLCLHFERKVPSDLLINLFKGIELNKSIVTLNLSIGFDTLAIEPPPNIPALMLKGITAKIFIHKKEKQIIVNAFTKMITKNKTIENLSITRTESIRDNIFHWADEKANFMSAIISVSRIKRLAISCNLLYTPLLGDLLKHNTTITSLTLNEVDSMYRNESSKGVFIYLVAGLKANSTLKRLILNSSEWYVHVPQGSQTYPKCSSFVIDLGVYTSGITNANIDSNIHLFHLLNAIKNHPSLEEFVFDYYSVVQRERIFSSLTNESKSEHITEFCSFSDKNQKALCNLLQNNKCLQSLTISGFNFTSEQLKQVSHALVLNGNRGSFNIMLTEMLSKDNTKKKELFKTEDFLNNEPQSDILQSLAMFSQSMQKLKQSVENKTRTVSNDDCENISIDSDFGYDYNKIDNNGDIIHVFKQVMFKAMLTVLSFVLSIRQARQKYFLHICH